MYAFSKSLLEPYGEYRVEVYNMLIFGYDDVEIEVELKIFGKGENEMYGAHYSIEREDGKMTEGACWNRPTKEETMLAVEKAIIKVLNGPTTYWK